MHGTSIYIGCVEMVRRIDIRHHVNEQCERRLASCAYREAGCTLTFPIGDRDEHERLYCKFVEHRDRLIKHSVNGRIIVTCLSCSEQMASRLLEAHRSNICPHRLMPCPHRDCTAIFQAHDLERHLKFNCSSVSCIYLMIYTFVRLYLIMIP